MNEEEEVIGDAGSTVSAMENEDFEASSSGERVTSLCKEATTMGDLSDMSSRGDEGELVVENTGFKYQVVR